MIRAIRLFVASAYALSIALSLLIGLTGGHHSPLLASGLGYLSMLIPAIGLFIVSVLACFDEIGWRAWLIPQLAARMGARGAVVASAILWACWHMPFALAGISFVDGIPIWLMAIILPFGVVGTGLVLGWL